MKYIDNIKKILLDKNKLDYNNLYGSVRHEGVNIPEIAFELNIREKISIGNVFEMMQDLYDNAVEHKLRLEDKISKQKEGYEKTVMEEALKYHINTIETLKILFN